MDDPLYNVSLKNQLHESSHAVVAWELGLDGPASIEFFEDYARTNQDNLETYPIDEQIMTYMAGPAADDLFFPTNGARRIRIKTYDGESDEDAISRLLQTIPYNQQSRKHDELLERTMAILRQRKSSIIALAKWMVTKATVSGKSAKKRYLNLKKS